MFLLQIVYSPAAEVNMCACQDPHWRCSSDATETALTRSPCHCAQVHVAWSLKTTSLARRKFLGGKRIGWCPFSWLISKHIMFSGALPVEARKQEKVQWTPKTWPIGRSVPSGNCVLLKAEKSQTSSIGAEKEKWRNVVSIIQSCYRSTLRLNFRVELSLALGNNTSVAPQCLELWVNSQGNPTSQEEGACSPSRKHYSCPVFRLRKTAMVTHF